MPMVNYTQQVSGPGVSQQSPMVGLSQGLQVGQQIGQAVVSAKARKRRNKILRILGQPDNLTRDKLKELGKTDPILAFEVMQAKRIMDKANREQNQEELNAALGQYKQVIDLTAQIASNLQQTPPEQRQQAFVEMMTPLAQNEALRPMAKRVAAYYQDGNFDDERLAAVQARAVGHKTHYDAQQAKVVRAEQSTTKQAEATHQSGLNIEEAGVDQTNRVALAERQSELNIAEEGVDQTNRISLAEKQSELRGGEEGGKQANREKLARMVTARVESVAKIKADTKKPLPMRIKELMQMVGPELTYATAMYALEPKNGLEKVMGPEGEETLVGADGKRINLKPLHDWANGVKPGDKPPAAGSPESLRERLTALAAQNAPPPQDAATNAASRYPGANPGVPRASVGQPRVIERPPNTLM